VDLAEKRELSRLEKQGLIKAFEFTYEITWNLLKDYLEFQGVAGIVGARDTFREALTQGLIFEGQKWMEMIPSRNETVHIYDEEIAEEIYHKYYKSISPCLKVYWKP